LAISAGSAAPHYKRYRALFQFLLPYSWLIGLTGLSPCQKTNFSISNIETSSCITSVKLVA